MGMNYQPAAKLIVQLENQADQGRQSAKAPADKLQAEIVLKLHADAPALQNQSQIKRVRNPRSRGSAQPTACQPCQQRHCNHRAGLSAI